MPQCSNDKETNRVRGGVKVQYYEHKRLVGAGRVDVVGGTEEAGREVQDHPVVNILFYPTTSFIIHFNSRL
ncbi:unnamed protein product, partial [Iphiclides podalirius]